MDCRSTEARELIFLVVHQMNSAELQSRVRIVYHTTFLFDETP